jgi:hypothetical protein
VIDRVCGAKGCRSDADVLIDHDDHGQLVVCEGCASGHRVIGHV